MSPQNHNTDWRREEIFAAGHLYLTGHYGEHDPVVIALANALGRTPGAIGWKVSQMYSSAPDYTGKPIVVTANVKEFMGLLGVDAKATTSAAEMAYDRIMNTQAQPAEFTVRMRDDGALRIHRPNGDMLAFDSDEAQVILQFGFRVGLADRGMVLAEE